MLEGRYSAATLERALLSARDAGFNLLRVWAGGIWQSEVFFDTADEVGLMVYHDQVNRGSYSGRPEDTAAYQQQLRRLSSHPALVAYSMCNECFPWAGGGIVPNLVDLVASEDESQPVWPACPAQGWTSEVNHPPLAQPGASELTSRWHPASVGAVSVAAVGSGQPAVVHARQQLVDCEQCAAAVRHRFDQREAAAHQQLLPASPALPAGPHTRSTGHHSVGG